MDTGRKQIEALEDIMHVELLMRRILMIIF